MFTYTVILSNICRLSIYPSIYLSIYLSIYIYISPVSSLRPETLRAAVVSDLTGNLEALKKGRHELEVGLHGAGSYYPKFIRSPKTFFMNKYIGILWENTRKYIPSRSPCKGMLGLQTEISSGVPKNIICFFHEIFTKINPPKNDPQCWHISHRIHVCYIYIW